MSRDAHLESHNSWMDANGKNVKTQWAASSFLAVIADRARRIACIGHFDSAFEEADMTDGKRAGNPVLLEYLAHAVETVGTGKDVDLRIHGGGVLTERTIAGEEVAMLNEAAIDAEVRKIVEQERAYFVEFFRAAGYRQKQMRIVWAEDNTMTKLTYHTDTGEIEMKTKSCMEE